MMEVDSILKGMDLSCVIMSLHYCSTILRRRRVKQREGERERERERERYKDIFILKVNGAAG